MARRFTLDYESPDWPAPPPRRRPAPSPVTRVGEWVTLAFAVVLTVAGARAMGVPRWHDVRALDALAFAAAASIGVVAGILALLHDRHDRARLAALGVLTNLFLALTALLVCACTQFG